MRRITRPGRPRTANAVLSPRQLRRPSGPDAIVPAPAKRARLRRRAPCLWAAPTAASTLRRISSSRHSRAIRRALSRGRVSPRRRASASTSSRNADMNSASPPPKPSDRAGAGTSPRAPARNATCATTRRSNGVSGPPGASAGTTHMAGPPVPMLARPGRPGGRAHLEPAPGGQVDQGRAEPELGQPPGQQADHGRRLVAGGRQHGRRPPPGPPPARPGRRRSDQQDDEQEQPPRAGDGGHRKHGISLRPVRRPRRPTVPECSPAVPDTAAAAVWFRRQERLTKSELSSILIKFNMPNELRWQPWPTS